MWPGLSDPRIEKTTSVVSDRKALLDKVGILVLTINWKESVDLQPPAYAVLNR
jgi:hypothetical protein